MKRVILGGSDKPADDSATTGRSRGSAANDSTGGGRARAPYDQDTFRPGRPAGSQPREQEEDSDETLRFGARRKSGAARADTGGGAEVDLSLAGWLVIVAGPGIGHAFAVRSGLNRLGRDRQSDIALTFGDKGISGTDHCYVVYDPRSREFSAQNGVGKNLTYVGDALAIDRKPLTHGTLISVSDTVLRFVPFCDESFNWPAQD